MSSHLCSHADPDITHCIVMDWQRSAGIFDDVSFSSQHAMDMATGVDGDSIDEMNSSSGDAFMLSQPFLHSSDMGYEI